MTLTALLVGEGGRTHTRQRGQSFPAFTDLNLNKKPIMGSKHIGNAADEHAGFNPALPIISNKELHFTSAKGINTMRNNLKKARQEAGLSQQAMADRLEITMRHYRYVESGDFIGRIEIWDKMEDMFGIHQRILRENFPEEQTK